MTAYLIEASLALAVFYMFYFLALREDSFHFRNRLYLLMSSAFALGLPLLQVPVPGGQVEDLAPLNLTGLVVVVEQWPAPAFLSSGGLKVLGWIYLAGVSFLLGRLLWRLGWLAHYIRLFKKTPKPGYCLVQTEGRLPTFSFLHYLFWDNAQGLSAEEESKILHHELAHIHGHHSLDMFYAELLTVFFWFHPAAYAYKQSLRNTHEFIADAAALRFCDRQSYQKLMVKRLFHQLHLRVIHNFNQNEIQKRLHQIQKRPTPAYWQLKMLLLLPVLGLTLMSLAGRLPEPLPTLPPVLSEEEQNRFATAEGGLDNFYREVAQRIQYPVSARRAGIEGRVYIQFSVMPDGSRQDFRVVKGLDPACDAAALAAVRQAKTPWLPARVAGQNVRQTVSIPVFFKIN